MTPTSTLADNVDVQFHLEAVAAALRARWSAAIVTGDFPTIDRVSEASHAVQRALIAMEDDRLVSPG